MILRYKFECPYCGENIKCFICEHETTVEVTDKGFVSTTKDYGMIKHEIANTTWYDVPGVVWSFRNLLFRNWTYEKAWQSCKKCDGNSYIPIFAKPDIQDRSFLYNLLEHYPSEEVTCSKKRLEEIGTHATVMFSKDAFMRSDGHGNYEGNLIQIYFDPIPDGALFIEDSKVFDSVWKFLKSEDFENHKFSLIGAFLSIKEHTLDRILGKYRSILFCFRLSLLTSVSRFRNRKKEREFDNSIDDIPF